MKFGLDRYTIHSFFEKVISKYADNPSIGSVGEEAISYREMDRRVTELQELFLQNGVGRGARVSIVGISNPNWALAYIAVMGLGAVAIPIMEEFPVSDIKHIIEFSEATALVLSDQIIKKLGDFPLANYKFLLKMDDLSLLHSAGAPAVQREEVYEDDLAEILFTSGTTGYSKGVMLTNRNLVSNIFEGPDILKCINEKSVVLNILPMAHAFGSTSAFLSIIYCGSSIFFLGKKPVVSTLMKAFKEVRPTILGGVPLIFEKIYTRKVAPLISGKALFRFLVKRKVGKKLLFSVIGKKFKAAFGGRMECAIIGGAALSDDVEEFLKVAGIPYALGYGMTESAPLITFQSREASRRGSVGWAIPDVEIEIENPEPVTGVGEILVRGPSVMKGYLKNPEATSKVLSNDGWLRTGDCGYLDEDGYLFLTGRSKNVIIGPSGENIYPEVIESLIAKSPYVEEVLVYAENHAIIGKIFPNKEFLATIRNSGGSAQWLEVVRKEVNAKLPAASRIVHMIEEKVPFIKTASNKIKRQENIARTIQ